MLNLNRDKFFFFYEDSSSLKIVPNSIEHGYLALLNNDLKAASLIFSGIDSPRANWAYILTSILNGYLQNYPTYFQIRNFLEIDLDLFLKNEKLDFIELIMGALEFLLPINQEVYKYAGRVLFENNLYTAALTYLEKSKKVYYKDAELHFLFAKYYVHINDFQQALFCLNECLKLIPEYYPALIIKKQIEEQWF